MVVSPSFPSSIPHLGLLAGQGTEVVAEPRVGVPALLLAGLLRPHTEPELNYLQPSLRDKHIPRDPLTR